MKNEDHLPLYGVGPLLVIPVLISAIIAINLSSNNMIPIYEIKPLNFLLTIFAILIIVYGLVFIITSLNSKIQDKIKNNQLETTGVYAVVRHPLYAGFLFVSTGIIISSHNIYLFILPVIYWIFLTVTLKYTEEKWLIELYGDEYIEYSKRVKRFLPRMMRI